MIAEGLNMSIRVFLSSKHKVVAEGIAAVVRTHPDMQLVGLSADTAHTQACCQDLGPDVLLVGIHAEPAPELDLIQRVSHGSAPIHIVAYSCESGRNAVMDILDAGAKGYVSTTSSIDDLMSAIRAAALGHAYLCQSTASEMMDHVRQSRSGDAPTRSHLGGREEQVLRLIADGYSSKEIARNLQIAPSTVEVHRRNIMRKVGLHKVADLTRYAIRNQMVSV
jgi:two-component system NarL family response regulator